MLKASSLIKQHNYKKQAVQNWNLSLRARLSKFIWKEDDSSQDNIFIYRENMRKQSIHFGKSINTKDKGIKKKLSQVLDRKTFPLPKTHIYEGDFNDRDNLLQEKDFLRDEKVGLNTANKLRQNAPRTTPRSPFDEVNDDDEDFDEEFPKHTLSIVDTRRLLDSLFENPFGSEETTNALEEIKTLPPESVAKLEQAVDNKNYAVQDYLKGILEKLDKERKTIIKLLTELAEKKSQNQNVNIEEETAKLKQAFDNIDRQRQELTKRQEEGNLIYALVKDINQKKTSSSSSGGFTKLGDPLKVTRKLFTDFPSNTESIEPEENILNEQDQKTDIEQEKEEQEESLLKSKIETKDREKQFDLTIKEPAKKEEEEKNFFSFQPPNVSITPIISNLEPKVLTKKIEPPQDVPNGTKIDEQFLQRKIISIIQKMGDSKSLFLYQFAYELERDVFEGTHLTIKIKNKNQNWDIVGPTELRKIFKNFMILLEWLNILVFGNRIPGNVFPDKFRPIVLDEAFKKRFKTINAGDFKEFGFFDFFNDSPTIMEIVLLTVILFITYGYWFYFEEEQKLNLFLKTLDIDELLLFENAKQRLLELSTVLKSIEYYGTADTVVIQTLQILKKNYNFSLSTFIDNENYTDLISGNYQELFRVLENRISIINLRVMNFSDIFYIRKYNAVDIDTIFDNVENTLRSHEFLWLFFEGDIKTSSTNSNMTSNSIFEMSVRLKLATNWTYKKFKQFNIEPISNDVSFQQLSALEVENQYTFIPPVERLISAYFDLLILYENDMNSGSGKYRNQIPDLFSEDVPNSNDMLLCRNIIYWFKNYLKKNKSSMWNSIKNAIAQIDNRRDNRPIDNSTYIVNILYPNGDNTKDLTLLPSRYFDTSLALLLFIYMLKEMENLMNLIKSKETNNVEMLSIAITLKKPKNIIGKVFGEFLFGDKLSDANLIKITNENLLESIIQQCTSFLTKISDLYIISPEFTKYVSLFDPISKKGPLNTAKIDVNFPNNFLLSISNYNPSAENKELNIMGLGDILFTMIALSTFALKKKDNIFYLFGSVGAKTSTAEYKDSLRTVFFNILSTVDQNPLLLNLLPQFKTVKAPSNPPGELIVTEESQKKTTTILPNEETTTTNPPISESPTPDVTPPKSPGISPPSSSTSSPVTSTSFSPARSPGDFSGSKSLSPPPSPGETESISPTRSSFSDTDSPSTPPPSASKLQPKEEEPKTPSILPNPNLETSIPKSPSIEPKSVLPDLSGIKPPTPVITPTVTEPSKTTITPTQPLSTSEPLTVESTATPIKEPSVAKSSTSFTPSSSTKPSVESVFKPFRTIDDNKQPPSTLISTEPLPDVLPFPSPLKTPTPTETVGLQPPTTSTTIPTGISQPPTTSTASESPPTPKPVPIELPKTTTVSPPTPKPSSIPEPKAVVKSSSETVVISTPQSKIEPKSNLIVQPTSEPTTGPTSTAALFEPKFTSTPKVTPESTTTSTPKPIPKPVVTSTPELPPKSAIKSTPVSTPKSTITKAPEPTPKPVTVPEPEISYELVFNDISLKQDLKDQPVKKDKYLANADQIIQFLEKIPLKNYSIQSIIQKVQNWLLSDNNVTSITSTHLLNFPSTLIVPDNYFTDSILYKLIVLDENSIDNSLNIFNSLVLKCQRMFLISGFGDFQKPDSLSRNGSKIFEMLSASKNIFLLKVCNAISFSKEDLDFKKKMLEFFINKSTSTNKFFQQGNDLIESSYTFISKVSENFLTAWNLNFTTDLFGNKLKGMFKFLTSPKIPIPSEKNQLLDNTCSIFGSFLGLGNEINTSSFTMRSHYFFTQERHSQQPTALGILEMPDKTYDEIMETHIDLLIHLLIISVIRNLVFLFSSKTFIDGVISRIKRDISGLNKTLLSNPKFNDLIKNLFDGMYFSCNGFAIKVQLQKLNPELVMIEPLKYLTETFIARLDSVQMRGIGYRIPVLNLKSQIDIFKKATEVPQTLSRLDYMTIITDPLNKTRNEKTETIQPITDVPNIATLINKPIAQKLEIDDFSDW